MSQEMQYYTLKSLEEFLARHKDAEGKMNFREALGGMRQEGLLLVDGRARVLPNPEMDSDTFYKTCNELPIDVTRVLEIPEDQYWDYVTREEVAFPPEVSVSCQRLLPGLAARRLKLEYFEIYYVKKGNAKLLFEDDDLTLLEGDLCILPPMTDHGLDMPESSFVLNVILRASNLDSRFGELLTMSGVFSGFFREALYGSAQPNLLMLHTKPGDRSMDLCFKGLGTEMARRDKHSWSATCCWVKLLLSNALRSCGEKVEIFRFPTGGNPRADCGEILQYIQQNYRTVRLSTLARQFHYNETYLSRMLQNYAHQSFTEIVRDIRMNRAVEYLTNSSLRVHEIAGLVGYSSVDHFSRAFKTMYGTSPQGYRRENRK